MTLRDPQKGFRYVVSFQNHATLSQMLHLLSPPPAKLVRDGQNFRVNIQRNRLRSCNLFCMSNMLLQTTAKGMVSKPRPNFVLFDPTSVKIPKEVSKMSE